MRVTKRTPTDECVWEKCIYFSYTEVGITATQSVQLEREDDGFIGDIVVEITRFEEGKVITMRLFNNMTSVPSYAFSNFIWPKWQHASL